MKNRVRRGQVTFDAEGNDIEGSPYFSRVVHWPGNELSGVTIGRGYDMGSRSKSDVLADLTKANVPSELAEQISEGAALKGQAAKKFVELNKKVLKPISNEQQVRLFELIYPQYELRAKKNYNRWTNSYSQRVAWNLLNCSIRDILVDFVYQGFTRGPNPMKAGMNNSAKELISYIGNTPQMKMYEAGRSRVKYLLNNQCI